jgi:hypothetical protein
MADSQVFREWSGHYIKKKSSFAIFTLTVAYVQVGLYGLYEGFYHTFSKDFYKIKPLLAHKGFGGVVIKLLLWL